MPNFKENLKRHRDKLRRQGLCVDCGKHPPKPGQNNRGISHVCCEACLAARRRRHHAGALSPLFRAIQRAERVNG